MFTKHAIMLAAAVFASISYSAPVEKPIEKRFNSGKRGMAYNDPGLTSQFSNSFISWAYNWVSNPGGTLNSAWEYVPMLHSNSPDFTGSWTTDANAAIAAGSTALLGFNEPDMDPSVGGTAMSPGDAVTAWNTYMQPFADKARLGAPAVSSSGNANQGLDWLNQFMSQCEGCKIDFVPFHWYDPNGDVQAFQDYAQKVHDQVQKPLWLTEFGMSGASDQAQAQYLSQMMPWIASTDYIERYSYFMVGQNILANADGSFTAAGTEYNTWVPS